MQSTNLYAVANAMAKFNHCVAPGRECHAWQDFLDECREKFHTMPWNEGAHEIAVTDQFAAYWYAVAEGLSADFNPLGDRLHS